MVLQRYQLEDSQLRTISVGLVGDERGNVRLRCSDGREYELEMYRASGLVHLARIKRTGD